MGDREDRIAGGGVERPRGGVVEKMPKSFWLCY